MFGNILDLVASIYTVTLCRLHRIFSGLNEVDLIASFLIDEINKATNKHQEQIRFRNLLAFVLGVNLPLKANEFLNLKYCDLFDENDSIKPYEYRLSRFHKDEIIYIPLNNSSKELLIKYSNYFGLKYVNDSNSLLFETREHKVMSAITFGRILTTANDAVGIEKNVGAETLRKTYGINIYSRSQDKLNSLLFLGKLWGRAQETQIINYLDLASKELDYGYYFGESFALCDLDFSKILCLKRSHQIVVDTSSAISKEKKSKEVKSPSVKKQKPPTRMNRRWSKEEKTEIAKKYLTQNITMKTLANQYDLDEPIVSRWVNEYKKFGEHAFEDKRKKKG